LLNAATPPDVHARKKLLGLLSGGKITGESSSGGVVDDAPQPAKGCDDSGIGTGNPGSGGFDAGKNLNEYPAHDRITGLIVEDPMLKNSN